MKKKVLLAFISLMLIGPALAGEMRKTTGELKDNKDRVSYSLGFQIGRDFKKERMDLDGDAFLKGVNDALGRKQPSVKKIISRQHAEKKEMVEQRLGYGKKFREEYAKKEGVVSLESGLMYRVIREGTGNTPKPTDKVKVNYTGKLIDGTEFSDSRRKGKPEVFHVMGVAKGISEALQLMKEGSRWEIVLPPELGFSRRSELGYRTLIYDLELISIEPESDKSAGE